VSIHSFAPSATFSGAVGLSDGLTTGGSRETRGFSGVAGFPAHPTANARASAAAIDVACLPVM
jgi:hypothetical protein